jgi:hypothetical protein
MIHCRESARLLSEQRDHRLPWRTRLALRLHMVVCSLCRVYGTQLSAVCGVCHEAGAKAPTHSPEQLPPTRKDAIKNAMARER